MSTSAAHAQRRSPPQRAGVGPIAQTRVSPALSASIDANLRPATDDQPRETMAEFVRAAVVNEVARRSQVKPVKPLSLSDVNERIDRLAAELQAMRNLDRQQLALLQQITSVLSPAIGG